MRHEKIVPGAILITLGLIFLLRSFGIIHIHWMNILHLWPIFLLIGGINLIFAHNKSPWASFLKIGVVILGFCILLFGNFNDRFNFWPGTYYYHGDNNDRDDDDDNDAPRKGIMKIEGNSTFSEPFHADARIAKLSINGGGTVYRISDTTNQLFQAYTKEFAGQYLYSHTVTDSVYSLDFSMKKNRTWHWDKNKENSATFKLNSAPIWDMDIAAGAAKLDFDLTKFKVRNFKVSGGMADFNVKIGQPLARTLVDINIGMAKVKIEVPKDAACQINTDSGLSSNHFNGFTKISDSHYETPGFAAAKNKITVKLDGGAADFEVVRY
jgi:hypothetical protein